MTAPAKNSSADRELWRALAVLAEEPSASHAPIVEALELDPAPDSAAHTDLFVFQLFPWASVYLGPEGQRGGEVEDRIAGFWRALGATPPAECDHVSVLLAAYADLAERVADARAERAARAFFWEYLGSWLPAFLARARELANGFYGRWAALAAATLRDEAAGLGGPPAEQPAALREAPPLPDPRRAGAEEFLDGLLAPARSGLVLVRDDLRRAGAGLGLAVRPGERRWVLRGLLSQDPPGLLAWLGGEARRQEALWARSFPRCAAAGHWSRRAAETTRLLDELARESRDATPA